MSDKKNVHKSKLLPFRYYSAHKTLIREGIGTSKTFDALEMAIRHSTENIKKMPGKTLISADVSGSMNCKISNKSEVTCSEIDKLVFVQERFFKYCDKSHHEIVFFYLMKYVDGTNILDGTYTDQGEKETLHWLPIDKLENINIVPSFLKTNLTKINENIVHIISKE